MATATAVPEVKAEETAEPKVRRNRLPLIIGAVVLLAAIGGGGYWVLGHKNAADATAEAEKKPVVEIAPTYLQLENFTVNLQPETGDQYLQVSISLKIADPTAVEGLKTRMPEIRNRMLMLLSSKKPSELVSTAGKEHLGIEVQDAINRIFTPETAESSATSGVIATAAAAESAPPTAPVAQAPAAATTETAAATTTPADLGKQLTAAANVPVATPKVEEPKVTHLSTPVSGVLFTSFIIQ